MRFHSKRLPRFRRRHKIARRRNGGLSSRLHWIRRRSRYRRNPDPYGKPWGPDLYNPLNDGEHPFKNESEYRKVIRPLYRKNPYRRNPYGYAHGSSEVDQTGLYKSIFARRRRNPYGYAHGSAESDQTGLYKSIFARRSRRRRRYNPLGGAWRRNPLGQARGEPVGSDASSGTGLYKSIFARNPDTSRRYRSNPDIFRWINRSVGEDEGRYLLVKVKEWKGRRGPTFTLIGSADTLKEAKNLKSTRAGLHVIVDTKTKKTWKAYIAQVYKFGRRPRNNRRYNPLGQNIFDTVDTWDSYWDRGRL